MKICITSTGTDPKSHIDMKFGRCACFIFHDTQNEDIEAIENPALKAMHGAGIQSSQLLVDRKTDILLTGNLGPNASSVLSNAGIKVFAVKDGTVEQAIADFKEGNLDIISGPTVKGHDIGNSASASDTNKDTE